MLGVVRSWVFTKQLQDYLPTGVRAIVVYSDWGRFLKVELTCKDPMTDKDITARVSIPRRTIEARPERLKHTAEFLLGKLGVWA